MARKEPDYSPIFAKLGNTPYRLEHFSSTLDKTVFIPAAEMTQLRRDIVSALDNVNTTTYRYSYRDKENPEAQYMTDTLTYRDNVANSLAESFYREHGVKHIEKALETTNAAEKGNLRLMTTRHCILRELGLCKKEKGHKAIAEPLTLSSGKNVFTLRFNCKDCEMQVLRIK